MTDSNKDSGDDVQPSRLPQESSSYAISSSSPIAPPPPYSSDVEHGAVNTSENRLLYSANPNSVPISHPSTLTHVSRSSSKRSLRAIIFFVICVFALTLHFHIRSVKDKKHQLTLDGLAWADLTPSKRCLHFDTREYSAQLMGVPRGEGGLRLCKEKGIIIHGINIKQPGYCTVDVDNSAPTKPRIYGHWTVDSNEPSCKTLWENFQDKGCVATGSKTRRIEAHMGNHQPPWDNWREMCSTTPADYDGHHFDQPDSCDHRGIFSGVWGVWFVRDESC
ncbi:uncharacterized protein EV420DRAFT_394270 [Desarmillaria tabescens]|uniref:Uncharacterized protein n=1 Tax=Armillaria tabescens TaxID=1929756 RepID=A0AA39N5T7_ARMTA|nr:uncharacterized protein EV420DRAFT_394270 [Desarmillaria tabescens]KAK0458360.1 hypothetical protein EV420DRAFT_394270 [Desarmillaria tabescens]